MCFHTQEDMDRYYNRLRNDPANTESFVIMRDAETSAFEEAYHCSVLDEQEIANTIRNLRAWHPGEHSVDLDMINNMRTHMNLSWLHEHRLPVPTGEAPASEDPSASVTADPMQRSSSYNPRNGFYVDYSYYVDRYIDMFNKRIQYNESMYIETVNFEVVGLPYTQYVEQSMRHVLETASWELIAPMQELIVPEQKRIFAKTDNWLDKFMREHKFREDEEVKLALAA